MRSPDLFALQPVAGHWQPMPAMRQCFYQESDRGFATAKGKTASGGSTSAAPVCPLAMALLPPSGSRPSSPRPCQGRIYLYLPRIAISRKGNPVGRLDSESAGFGNIFFGSLGGGDSSPFPGLLRLGPVSTTSNSEKGGEVLFSDGGIITKMRA